MVLAKISQELKKIVEYPLHQLLRPGCLEIHITLANPNINVSSGSGLPSLVYPYFELDIELDKKHKALLINQETEWFCSLLLIPTS